MNEHQNENGQDATEAVWDPRPHAGSRGESATGVGAATASRRKGDRRHPCRGPSPGTLPVTGGAGRRGVAPKVHPLVHGAPGGPGGTFLGPALSTGHDWL